MTIDEAIKKQRELALIAHARTRNLENKVFSKRKNELGDYYSQIADWLEELKAMKLKQIPKAPFFEGDGYYDGNLVYDTWRCPECDSKYEIEFDEHEYCPHCGQAIKWE